MLRSSRDPFQLILLAGDVFLQLPYPVLQLLRLLAVLTPLLVHFLKSQVQELHLFGSLAFSAGNHCVEMLVGKFDFHILEELRLSWTLLTPGVKLLLECCKLLSEFLGSVDPIGLYLHAKVSAGLFEHLLEVANPATQIHTAKFGEAPIKLLL